MYHVDEQHSMRMHTRSVEQHRDSEDRARICLLGDCSQPTKYGTARSSRSAAASVLHRARVSELSRCFTNALRRSSSCVFLKQPHLRSEHEAAAADPRCTSAAEWQPRSTRYLAIELISLIASAGCVVSSHSYFDWNGMRRMRRWRCTARQSVPTHARFG